MTRREKIKLEIEIFKLTDKEEKRQDKTRQGKARLEKRRKKMNKRREDVEEMRTKNKNSNKIDM